MSGDPLTILMYIIFKFSSLVVKARDKLMGTANTLANTTLFHTTELAHNVALPTPLSLRGSGTVVLAN